MPVEKHSPKGAKLLRFKRGFGTFHNAVYRMSRGRLMGTIMGTINRTPVLLLTTTGRRTGEARTVPLVYFEQGGSYVVAASNGGHWEPAWYLSLVANSSVRVEVGSRKFDARARVAAGEERSELWAKMESHHPSFANYPVMRGIDIPMVALDPA